MARWLSYLHESQMCWKPEARINPVQPLCTGVIGEQSNMFQRRLLVLNLWLKPLMLTMAFTSLAKASVVLS